MPSSSEPAVTVQLEGVDQLAPFAAAFQTKVAPVEASTDRLNAVVDARPSASVPVTTTCWLSAPVVSNDQDQVPSSLRVTVPTEAVRTTESVPGSDQVPVFVAVAPAETLRLPALARTGGRFSTTRSNAAVAVAPSLSVAVMVTVRPSSGPSAVARLQDQVPLAFLTTVPAEAERVTESAPGSPQVPVLVAVRPSPTVTGPAAATVGGRLVTVSSKAEVPTAPSLSVAVTVTVCVASGPSSGVKAQVQEPLASRTTVPAETVSETVSAPGSNQVPEFEATRPSPTVTAPADVTAGTTLVTVRRKVVVRTPPSASVAVMVTLPPCSGPSVVARDHDQVPASSLRTEPVEAERVTMSPPGSDQVPVLTAVEPSPTETSPEDASSGGTLVTESVKAARPAAPWESVAVIVTWEPSTAGPDQVQVPASVPAATAPMLAARTKASPSASETVPETWAVVPSGRETTEEATATTGATFGAEVAVANTRSAPKAVPLVFTATARKWYSRPGTRPVRTASTGVSSSPETVAGTAGTSVPYEVFVPYWKVTAVVAFRARIRAWRRADTPTASVAASVVTEAASSPTPWTAKS